MVALLAPTLHQARAAEEIEMGATGVGPGTSTGLLNLTGGNLAPGSHQEEEHLKPREVSQGP